MRYKFYEQLANIKKNPGYVLPEDINKPIIDWLDKIGCHEGALKIIEHQKCVRYKGLEITNADVPDAKITIQIDAGMVGERKDWEKSVFGKWTIIEYGTVKNPNLDKHKQKREIDHE